MACRKHFTGLASGAFCVAQGKEVEGLQGRWLPAAARLLAALAVLAPIAMTFVDPRGDVFEERSADSFVDDASIGCGDAHLETAVPFAELIAKGQERAQIWERVLRSSGGALELKKCFWRVVYWQWVNGRPEMVPSIGCPGVIALASGSAPSYAVTPRLEAREARRALGARPAPDGSYRKEGEFLMNKANQRASRLAASNLSEMDVFIFHRSARAASMTRSLPVTTFEPKVLSKTQSKAIRAILNKLGVNKSFPRRVAFGPKDARGVALLGVERRSRSTTSATPHRPRVLKRLRWESHGHCFAITAARIGLWLPPAGAPQ